LRRDFRAGDFRAGDFRFDLRCDLRCDLRAGDLERLRARDLRRDFRAGDFRRGWSQGDTPSFSTLTHLTDFPVILASQSFPSFPRKICPAQSLAE
jgi:hypothetical protein